MVDEADSVFIDEARTPRIISASKPGGGASVGAGDAGCSSVAASASKAGAGHNTRADVVLSQPAWFERKNLQARALENAMGEAVEQRAHQRRGEKDWAFFHVDLVTFKEGSLFLIIFIHNTIRR